MVFKLTVGGQGITIGLDTATKNLISNSSTAVDTLGKIHSH